MANCDLYVCGRVDFAVLIRIELPAASLSVTVHSGALLIPAARITIRPRLLG